MSPLDELPPDLRATLSLLVDRGKSYAQVADLLGIPEAVVRDRAHAALDALAGGPDAGGIHAPTRYAPARQTPVRDAPEPEATPQRTPAPREAAPSGTSRTSPSLPVSRRGGAILLTGIVVVVVVVVLALTSSGGSSSHNTGQSTAGTTSTVTSTSGGSSSASHTSTGGSKKTSTSAKSPQITKQINLTPPEPSSKSIGLVEVLTEGAQHAFYIAAEKLPPSNGFFYVVWLYDSPTKAEAISKAPTVKSDGRLQGGALLPTNAAEYHKILLTHETDERATTPGPVVLSGPFSLG